MKVTKTSTTTAPVPVVVVEVLDAEADLASIRGLKEIKPTMKEKDPSVKKVVESSHHRQNVSSAQQRLEEKRREFKALKAILLKKHQQTTEEYAALVVERKHDASKDNIKCSNKKIKVESTNNKGDCEQKQEEVTSDPTIVATLDKKDANQKKKAPVDRPNVKNIKKTARTRLWKNGMKKRQQQQINSVCGITRLIASEIVFACTPAFHVEEDDEEEHDSHVLLCSSVQNTASRMTGCVGSHNDVHVHEKEVEGVEKDSKPKINIGFMPKMKASSKKKSILLDPSITLTTNDEEDEEDIDVDDDDDEDDEDDEFTVDEETAAFTAASESITSESLMHLLTERHQRKTKKALQKNRKLLQQFPKQQTKQQQTDSYELGTNSILTGSATTLTSKEECTFSLGSSGSDKKPDASSSKPRKDKPAPLSLGRGNSSDPIVLDQTENDAVPKNDANKTYYRGKATADEPLLLFSESMDEDEGVVNMEMTQRLIRLMSKEGGKIRISKKGNGAAVSFAPATPTNNHTRSTTFNEADDTADTDNHTRYTTSKDMDDEVDNSSVAEEEYQDMDEKIRFLQMRLAKAKRKQKEERKLKVQNEAAIREKSNKKDTNDATTNEKQLDNVVEDKDHEERTHSGRSNVTRATVLRDNTTAASKSVFTVKHGEEDIRDDDDNVDTREEVEDTPENVRKSEKDELFPTAETPDKPLNAEQMYNSTYRSERRRKDLEEMKQMLASNRRKKALGDPAYFGGLFDDDREPVNVYDMQRASNQGVLHALRQRHLDVVRMQFQEDLE